MGLRQDLEPLDALPWVVQCYLLLVYFAGSGVNRVQVVLSELSVIYRVQRYSSSMHRAMEEDGLMTRYDDSDCEIVMFCPGKNFMCVWLYVFLGCTRSCVCVCHRCRT